MSTDTNLRGPFPDPEHALTPMPYQEQTRVRMAAYAAKRQYPGPIGEMVARELSSWADFGWRLGGHRMVMAVVEDVLARRETAA